MACESILQVKKNPGISVTVNATLCLVWAKDIVASPGTDERKRYLHMTS